MPTTLTRHRYQRKPLFKAFNKTFPQHVPLNPSENIPLYLFSITLASRNYGENAEKYEHEHVFHLFRSCQLSSEAGHCPAANSGTRWSSLDNHAAEGNTAVVSHARRYRTEIHTETSFLLTTKDSSQHTTPINMQSMSET